jgi:hypothetical protein
MVPPSCALDEAALGAQLARYRAVGAAAEVAERSGRRLSIHVGDDVPAALVEQLIAVEMGCCPFFDLRWNPVARQLSISVSGSDHVPALDAVANALGFS